MDTYRRQLHHIWAAWPFFAVALIAAGLSVFSNLQDAWAQSTSDTTLTVRVNGNGDGEVTSPIGPINCNKSESDIQSENCIADFSPGFRTTLTLTATPAADSRFVGWSGFCSGSSPTCSVPVGELDRTITATFNVQDQSITVTPTSGVPRTDTVTITGRNYPAATYTIRFDGQTGVGSPVVVSDSGTFTQSFVVPWAPSGARTVRVGAGIATFNVVSGTTLTPDSGPAGSDVEVTGEGFEANNSRLPLRFGTQTLNPVSSDAQGSIRATFQVPDLAAGSYRVILGTATPVTFTIASELRLGSTSGSPGDTVQVTGSGFRANSSLNLTFDGNAIRSVPVDSHGKVATSFQVPESPAGPTSVALGDRSTSFRVTPKLTLETGAAVPGAAVRVTGTGFSRNERNIIISVGGTRVATGVSTDASGSWSHSVEVPSLPAGTHQVVASGTSTQSSSAPSAPLTLGSLVTLEQPSGPPGTVLTIHGSGFRPQETVRVAAGNNLVTASVRADNGGAWSTSLEVPNSPGGALVISATGTGQRRTESEFTVTPQVTLSRTSGPPNSSIDMEGSGFPANAAGITIRFADTVVASLAADGQGSFTRPFSVPQAATGSYMLTIGGSGATLRIPFEVTPRITLDGATGGQRGSMTVRGSGFAADEGDITLTLQDIPVASGITANSHGSWSATFGAPPLPSGIYSLRASGARTAISSVPEVTVSLTTHMRLDRASGSPGDSLLISGGGFSPGSGVTIVVGDNLFQTTTVADDTGSWSASITIPTAPGGRLAIAASGPNGETEGATFMITPNVSLSEAFSQPGKAIDMTGHGFEPGQSLSVSLGNSSIASPVADSRGSWTSQFIVPASPAGSYPLTIKTIGGDLKIPFLISAGISLSVSRASPTDTIVVSGSGFSQSERGISVSVERTAVASGISADRRGSWDVTIGAPPLPGGSYEVWASGSTTSANDSGTELLTIVPGLHMSPESGPPGTRVNVTGRGFGAGQRDIRISFNGTPVALVVAADDTGGFATAFEVPDSPSGLHFVGHSGSTVIMESGPGSGFQVTPGVSLERVTGPPGVDLQIHGSGFPTNDPGITISFDGSPLKEGITADADGSFTTSVEVPHSTAGVHKVSAIASGLGGLTSSLEDFEITPALILEPEFGSVRDTLQVTGLGFSPQSQISIDYGDGILDTASVTDTLGTFESSIVIPASGSGEHLIVATDEENIDATATFVLERIPPPAPILLLPEDGTGGGLLGGFRPELSWEPVEDPSGVTYDFQISSDSEFASTVLEQTGLATPAHAIAEEAALDRGKYYWRVRAVDMANNAGPWTGPFEVKSGVLPVWLVPLVVVLLAAVAGGGGYAYLSRRRYQSTKEPAFPQLAREAATAPALPGTASTGGTAPTPRSIPRLALPSSPLRRRRTRSPEEEAQLRLVVDFLRSLPLLEINSDLGWLDELVEAAGNAEADAFERVLEGDINLGYQPAWLRHPTFETVRQVLQGHPFLEELEAFVEAVDSCTVDTVELLRRVYHDVADGAPDGAVRVYRWRFVLGVIKHSLGWFRGSYLREPSVRDYRIEPFNDDGEEPLVTLVGEDTTPFAGTLIQGVIESDAIAYRDLHLALRGNYTDSENARSLASRLTSLEILRQQMTSNLEQLGDVS